MKTFLTAAIGTLCSVLFCGTLFAENMDSTEIKKINQISVAIIDFESKAPGNPELGSQISDILTARLSIYDQYRLVERKKLEDLLKEQELNLTGMMDQDRAIKVGKLLGAKIMIFGRIFPVDKDLYMVAKIIGTETSMVKGVMAKGKLESELSDILDQLVEKLSDTMEQKVAELLPKNEQYENKIEHLKKQLEGKKLPKIAVVIPEIHINREIIDPAAETEIKKMLSEFGFEISDVKGTGLSKWARDFMAKNDKSVSALLGDTDIVIVGEGFSEFATRLNGLYSCTARLEINVIQRETGKVIFSDSSTQRGIDLSEFIAAKTALQKSGHELGIKLLEDIVNRTNMEQSKDVTKVDEEKRAPDKN